MGNDLKRLLAAKDESHYGVTLVDTGKAERLVGQAKRMTDLANSTLIQ